MNGLISIDREGIVFAGIFAFVALIGTLINVHIGWIMWLLTIGCICFFRDPIRVSPQLKNVILSPADGRVQLITNCDTPAELGLGYNKCQRISIFMSVFDVHVNRSPVNGTVQRIVYTPGKFVNASLDKASEFNERQAVIVKTESGANMAFVQIAGLIARRIRCDIRETDQLRIGQKVGLIRFGSRVDVYLPTNINLQILEGQTLIAGETILGFLGK